LFPIPPNLVPNVSSRSCPSCGQTKDEKEFWSGARRCRKCVAKETAARRSRRASEEREHLKKKFDLKVGVSARRFRELEREAQEAAVGFQ
jgi:hypothetical protein